VKAQKPRKMRWYEDINSLNYTGAARNVRLSHNLSAEERAWERYALCSRCGSQRIKTMPAKGFVPTAATEAAASAPPAAAQEPPAPPGDPNRPFSPGDRVSISALGYRGETGVVTGSPGVLGLVKVRRDKNGKEIKVAKQDVKHLD